MRPARQRELAAYLQVAYKVSERRACTALSANRSSCRYVSRADRQEELRVRIKDLASGRPGYGYRRLHVLLGREGWKINHKRVYRLYKEEGLMLRKKPPKRRISAAKRIGRPVPQERNESWSMDFVWDQLYSGQSLRVLTIVDNHSRESLAMPVQKKFTGTDVATVLEHLVQERGRPQSIRVDNGPEFRSVALDLWA